MSSLELSRRRALAMLGAGFAAALAGCGGGAARAVSPPQSASPLEDLDRRYDALVGASRGHFGPGGLGVLAVAHEALRAGKAAGKWPHVGIEDLWAHAIKEGSVLFEDPDRRWGKTGPEETKDLIGQTTIGPWQMAVQNVRNIHGPTYGLDPAWSDGEVYAWARENPGIQAAMISDLIAANYAHRGVRNPYAIQEYFWLAAYVKGDIGQGPWDASVLATPPPGGTWQDLTDDDKRRTGFYAKQLVCGSRTNPYGLSYWLAVSGDEAGLRTLLRTWRDALRWRWDDARNEAVPTDEPAHLAIEPDDFKYLGDFPREQELLAALAGEVIAER